MNVADATDLVAHMMRWWPQSADRLRDPVVAKTYAEHLSDVALAHARAAVEAWSRDGKAWPPNAGELRGRLVDLAIDPPAWWQVKAAVIGQTPVPPDAPELPESCLHGECDGSGWMEDWVANDRWPCRCRPERHAILRRRRGHHPLVAEFLRLVGPAEVADIAGDRTAEAQVRTKWEEFVADARRIIAYAGMDPAGLPQLERLTAPIVAGGQLGRLDPAGLLRGAA